MRQTAKYVIAERHATPKSNRKRHECPLASLSRAKRGSHAPKRVESTSMASIEMDRRDMGMPAPHAGAKRGGFWMARAPGWLPRARAISFICLSPIEMNWSNCGATHDDEAT